jgi:diguanylate cyclase (GGDEF)-like protein/PAS domain S-box-containing protein
MMVFSSANPHATPLDLSDREHVQVHLKSGEDRLFVSKPVLGRVTRRWSVQFSRPIHAEDGRLAGVIIASVAPEYFARFFNRLDLGSDATIALARFDGAVLAHVSRNLSSDKSMGLVLDSPALADPQHVPSGRYRRNSQVDGIERFHAWRSLPQYGLVVIVGQSVADAYARYARQEQVYTRAGMAISALIGMFSWLMLSAMHRRWLAANELADAEARWKFALEGAGDGVWDWDFTTQQARLSRRAREILQVDGDTVSCTQEALRERVHPDDIYVVNKALQSHFDGDTDTYLAEHRVKARDGGWAWILSRGMLVKRTPDGRPLRMVGTFSDIDDRKAREATIMFQAEHDALTGVPNRTLLADRLRQAILRAQRDSGQLALLYFDLDRFKPVNDQYGHEAGDKLLKAVAQRVRTCLRESDTVARIGGDEFVVLLPKITAEADAIGVANNVLEAVSRPFDIDGHAVAISASIGIASYPTDGSDGDALMRCADRAMYEAKTAGRHCVRTCHQRLDG